MTTENNIAAQAGDEPMQEAFEEWVATAVHPEGSYKLAKTVSGAYINAETRCAFWAFTAAQVSPRATAEGGVKQVSYTCEMKLTGHPDNQRPYCDHCMPVMKNVKNK